MHVEPASPGVRVEPEIVQVPDTFDQVTAPAPDPPDATSGSDCPKVAVVDETVSTAWFTRAIVRVPLLRVSVYRLALPAPYDTAGMME
jgi:hypothetical protein